MIIELPDHVYCFCVFTLLLLKETYYVKRPLDYVSFFIPCMFICMSISVALKVYHWRKKWSWTPWLLDQALDAMSAWILVCCFVQSQIWMICNPELTMALWATAPYGVFVWAYILRKRMSTTEKKMEPYDEETAFLYEKD